MKFEINFNKHEEQDDDFLLSLGAKVVELDNRKYPPFELLEIELNTFEELELLLENVDKVKGFGHTALVSFDNPMIFLDKTI